MTISELELARKVLAREEKFCRQWKWTKWVAMFLCLVVFVTMTWPLLSMGGPYETEALRRHNLSIGGRIADPDVLVAYLALRNELRMEIITLVGAMVCCGMSIGTVIIFLANWNQGRERAVLAKLRRGLLESAEITEDGEED